MSRLAAIPLMFTLACGGPASPAAPRGPTAATSISASPSATTSAVSPGPSSEQPLVVIAELPERMHLHAIDEVMLAVSTLRNDSTKGGTGGGEIGYRMGIVDALGRYTEKPELLLQAGMMSFFVVAARGKFPQGVDLLATDNTGRTGIARHLTLNEKGVWKDKTYQEGYEYVGLAVLDGSTVTARVGWGMNQAKPTLVTLRGPNVSRTFTKADERCARALTNGNADFPTFLIPQIAVTPGAIGATRKGTLISVGSGCGVEEDVEIWSPSATTSTLASSAPGTRTSGAPQVLQGRGEDEAWIVNASGGVARFIDGRIEPLPQLPAPTAPASAGAAARVPGVAEIALSRAGVLHARTPEETKYDYNAGVHRVTQASSLYRWKDSAWELVPTPESPTSLATASDGTLWLTANRLLLRERLTPEEQSQAVTVASEESAIRPRPGRMSRTPGPLCPQNVVVMYGFTKVTPDDYDFPLTRKALKGQQGLEGVRFVVAKDGGQKFFSALVPDLATGTKLRGLIEKKVQGSKPQLLCAQPEILRELRIDLATGEVVKP